MKRINYGIDAPNVLAWLTACAFACVALAALFPVVNWLYSPEISLLATVALWLYGSLVGKLYLAKKLVKIAALEGDERVLDVGCGSGLLLNAAAKRLPSGKSVGVDIWRKEDLAGNNVDRTLRNAQLEGVADRVDVKAGDVRSLPFEDESFDRVVSLNVLHNISMRPERDQAIKEIYRVLTPGGQFIICDFRNVGEYVTTFREVGASDAERRYIGFVGVFPMFAAVGSRPMQ